MIHLADRDADDGFFLGFKMVGGDFKAVVPQSTFAGTDFLDFLPLRDAHFGADAAGGFFVNRRRFPRHRRMLGAIGHRHHMIAVGVLEEIVNPFFFHQAAGEIEVRLAILHTEIPWIIGPGEFVTEIEPGKHMFENIGHRKVLKNSALDSFREQPELRHHLGAEVEKIFIAPALAEAPDDAVEIARAAVHLVNFHRDALPDDGVEGDGIGEIRNQGKVELEKMRNLLATLQSGEQQDVRSQRGGYFQRSIGLCVARHACLPGGFYHVRVKSFPIGSARLSARPSDLGEVGQVPDLPSGDVFESAGLPFPH